MEEQRDMCEIRQQARKRLQEQFGLSNGTYEGTMEWVSGADITESSPYMTRKKAEAKLRSQLPEDEYEVKLDEEHVLDMNWQVISGKDLGAGGKASIFVRRKK